MRTLGWQSWGSQPPACFPLCWRWHRLLGQQTVLLGDPTLTPTPFFFQSPESLYSFLSQGLCQCCSLCQESHPPHLPSTASPVEWIPAQMTSPSPRGPPDLVGHLGPVNAGLPIGPGPSTTSLRQRGALHGTLSSLQSQPSESASVRVPPLLDSSPQHVAGLCIHTNTHTQTHT